MGLRGAQIRIPEIKELQICRGCGGRAKLREGKCCGCRGREQRIRSAQIKREAKKNLESFLQNS
jgi:hypothetical protein